MTLREVLNLSIRNLENGHRLEDLLKLRKTLRKEINEKIAMYQKYIADDAQIVNMLADDVDFYTRIHAVEEITWYIITNYSKENLRFYLRQNRKY